MDIKSWLYEKVNADGIIKDNQKIRIDGGIITSVDNETGGCDVEGCDCTRGKHYISVSAPRDKNESRVRGFTAYFETYEERKHFQEDNDVEAKETLTFSDYEQVKVKFLSRLGKLI